jgi:hypothetical protein
VSGARAVDCSVAVGGVRLPNAVIAAPGTFGYGTEFAGSSTWRTSVRSR